MLSASAWLAAGLVLLYLGAEGLVRGSANLALRLGIPPLVVGLTVVAFGTSAPELVVSVQAAFDGFGDIAVGNVVGSNVFNIAVILGLAALVRPLAVNSQVVKFDTPIMVAASGLLVAVGWDRYIDRTEAAVLLAAFITYVIITVKLARTPVQQTAGSGGLAGAPKPRTAWWRDPVLAGAGLAALVAGSTFFIKGAVGLARALGISEAVIGLTLVAAGTSLPELATSIVAAARKEMDIAVGNIVGSNIFNIFAILGTAAAITPLGAFGIGPAAIVFMAVTAVILLPFLRTGFVLGRLEAAALLVLYGGYLYCLWP